jgi:hypothetical protein
MSSLMLATFRGKKNIFELPIGTYDITDRLSPLVKTCATYFSVKKLYFATQCIYLFLRFLKTNGNFYLKYINTFVFLLEK